MATAQEIISTILDNSFSDYVAQTTGDNRVSIEKIGNYITSSTDNMNAFIGALIDKVVQTHVKNKIFNNPLSKLKGAGVPYGANIEETFINPSTDLGYQTDPTLLLKNYTPDGKACYYGQNRKSTFAVTIQEETLRKAFRSDQDFMQFYNSIVSSLYSGDNITEFEMTKRVFGIACELYKMPTVAYDLKTGSAKELMKSISNMSKLFTFNSKSFAPYNLVNKSDIDAGTTTAVQTFCPVENQVLLIRADVQTEIDYEVLATMFHMEVAKLEAMTIVVDDFPINVGGGNRASLKGCYAVLCDREAIQIRDKVFRVESQFNPSNLSWNVFLHHWQFIYLSMFANCVAFVEE